MSSVNKVILIGHLGRDPEIRVTQAGARLCNLSVATAESWTDKATGERREKTEWHRVVIWNEPLVALAERFLKKGSRLYLEGALETRKYVDQSGAEKTSTEIVLKPFKGEIQLLESRQDESPRQGPAARARAPNQTQSGAAQPAMAHPAALDRARMGGFTPPAFPGARKQDDFDEDPPF